MLGGAACITARPADPMLWPPRAARGTIEIVVVSNGYHAGLALPRAALARVRERARLSGADRRHAALRGLRLDRVRLGRPRILPVGADRRRLLAAARAARAVLGPAITSVLHVVGIGGDPAQAFTGAELVRVPLSRNGFDQLLAKLDATFVPPQGGALPDLGRGLYGPSLFYPANGTFSIFTRLQSLDRRSARRRRAADHPGARDAAGRR